MPNISLKTILLVLVVMASFFGNVAYLHGAVFNIQNDFMRLANCYERQSVAFYDILVISIIIIRLWILIAIPFIPMYSYFYKISVLLLLVISIWRHFIDLPWLDLRTTLEGNLPFITLSVTFLLVKFRDTKKLRTL